MKGFMINNGEKNVYGAVDKGVTNVMISNKEGSYRLYFGSMDDANVSYTWHVADLELGDSLTITYGEIGQVSEPQRTGGGRNTLEDDLSLLESYYKLKQELTEEGLITPEQ